MKNKRLLSTNVFYQCYKLNNIVYKFKKAVTYIYLTNVTALNYFDLIIN